MAGDRFVTQVPTRNMFASLWQYLTQPPEQARGNRRGKYLLVALVSVTLLVLCAPSIVSHSPLGPFLLSRFASAYGLRLQVNSVRIGWATPLRLSGVKIRCQSESDLFRVAQIDSQLTMGGLIGSSKQPPVDWSVQGVDVHCSVQNDRCSL